MHWVHPVFAERLCAQIFLVVGEEPRFFEFAHHLRELCRGERLLERIGAGAKYLAAVARSSPPARAKDRAPCRSSHGARRSARSKSIARMSPQALTHSRCDFALVHVDLVGEVDRLLGTGVDAGVAARAHLQSIGLSCSQATSNSPR